MGGRAGAGAGRALRRRGGGRGRGRSVNAPPRSLRTTRGTLALGGRTWLMGIVNATPDSFSDAGVAMTPAQRVELARSLVQAGADIIDIGGESGVTNRPPVEPAEEIERVVPVIEQVVD